MYMAGLLTEDDTEDGVASTDSPEELTAQSGAAAACYLSRDSSDDFKSSCSTNLETLTAAASSNDAVNALVGIIDDRFGGIDEDSEYDTSTALASGTSAFLSLLSVLKESDSTGDLSLDPGSMSRDSDALACLEELLASLRAAAAAGKEEQNLTAL